MRTCRTPCVTAKPDKLSCLNLLVFYCYRLRKVGVERLQTVVVADDDIITIAVCVVRNDTHGAVKDRHYRVTYLESYIGAVMVTATACAEVGSNPIVVISFDRKDKTAAIDPSAIG